MAKARPRRVCSYAVVAVLLGLPGCDRGRVQQEERLRQGAQLFHAQGCILCHGREGHGDGERSQGLNPRPRDFRDRSAYIQGTAASDIAATLSTGIRIRSAQMPAFSHLSEGERLALGEFVVSLQRNAKDSPRATQ